MVIPLILALFSGCVDEYPDFSRAVFAEANPKTETIDTIKIVLNQDHRGSIQLTGKDNDGIQGTWQIQSSDEVKKVVFNGNGENILITFYKNNEVSISTSNFQAFGRWYQE
jgi:hypothetical protein